MKRCPQCNRVEHDEALKFCRADGATLVNDSSSPGGEAGTMLLGGATAPSETTTNLLPHAPDAATGLTSTQTTVLTPQTTHNTRELTKPARRKAVLVGLVAVTAAVAVAAAGYFVLAKRDRPIESVAVLPFENRSGSADSDYLSDGLSESLIFRLSKLPGLKVSPTSSVLRYKGKAADVAQVARELEVDAVLSGRVAQRGDDLTISVELVDARTRKLLWGEQYERKMSELLETQRDIASEITNRLRLKLSGEGEQRLAKKYTDNNEAYQLYLQGRYHWAKRTKDEIEKAVECYRQAIALDPNFALAYVGIADAYNSMGKNPDAAPKEAIPKAEDAARQTLSIDPSLAEAHAALADSSALYDWDWSLAGREFDRALELDPNVAYTHLARASTYLTPLRRADEAVAEMNRALEIEPLSLINNAVLVTGYLNARQNDKALQQGRKALDLDPNFWIAYHWLGAAYVANGQYDEAVKLGEQGLQKWPSKTELLFVVGEAYAKQGRRREAEQYVDKIREAGKKQYVRTYWLACIYAALGDKDKAFAELERSYQDRDCFLPRANIDPAMDPLRDDPRFADLMKRVGLPQ